jgi:microcystin-dependent protein
MQNIINIVLILAVVYIIFRLPSMEQMSNVDKATEDKIREIYKIDTDAIRNLSNLAKDLTVGGKLRVPGGLEIDGSLKVKGFTEQLGGGSVEGKLYYRHQGANGNDDSDPYFIEKVRTSANNNHLRLTINDDGNESFQIWGNSCGSEGGCGGAGRELFNFSANGALDFLPRGCIIAWNTITAPKGWAICDGQNGTPDLRGRFIRMWNDIGFKQNHSWHGGATNSTVRIKGVNPQDSLRSYKRGHNHGIIMKHHLNDVGGTDVYTLTVGEMPSHTHTVRTRGMDGGGWIATQNNGRLAGSDRWHHGNEFTNPHPFLQHTGGNWGHGVSNPYYVLTYIMRL